MAKFIVFALLMISSSITWAYTELSGEFGYDRNVYGANRENKQTSRSYSGSMALYIFNYTALEFSIQDVKDITNDKTISTYAAEDVAVVKTYSTVKHNMYGIGLKQSFASKNAFIRPSISLGYARQYTRSSRAVTYEVLSTKNQVELQDTPTKERYDAISAGFTLAINLARGFGIQGSVKTTFPMFKMNQASDSLKYLAGINWMF